MYIKHQGKKGDGNTLEAVVEGTGDSAKTVQRYIQLSRLIDGLLDMVDAKKIALAAAKVLDGKKARDIKILCINEKTIIADYFVIAMGTSTTQVNSLAGEVEYKLGEELGIHPSRTEGEGSGTWVLLDYNSVIVHLFG